MHAGGSSAAPETTAYSCLEDYQPLGQPLREVPLPRAQQQLRLSWCLLLPQMSQLRPQAVSLLLLLVMNPLPWQQKMLLRRQSWRVMMQAPVLLLRLLSKRRYGKPNCNP